MRKIQIKCCGGSVEGEIPALVDQGGLHGGCGLCMGLGRNSRMVQKMRAAGPKVQSQETWLPFPVVTTLLHWPVQGRKGPDWVLCNVRIKTGTFFFFPVGQGILSRFVKNWSYIPLCMLREVWGRTPLLRGLWGKWRRGWDELERVMRGYMEESVVISGSQTVLKESLVFQWENRGSCREDRMST